MSQLSLGEMLRDDGIERVAEHNEDWLTAARAEARRICAIHGSVSAVDIRKWADARCNGLGFYPDHPNAWGAIFKGLEWVPTGHWQKCQHPDGHARAVRVWRLRG